MRNSFRLLSTGLVLVILGVILTVFVSGDMIDNAKKAVDHSTLQMEDFKEGMMVEGDLMWNYGSYETLTKEKDNGSSSIVGYYYLIDAGEEGIMGLYTPKKDLIKQLDAQYKAWQYAETQADLDAIDTVHFKGKVEKMDSEDKKIFRQYLKKTYGFTDEEVDNYGVELVIKVKDGMPVFLLPIGIVVVIVGLLLMFMFIRRKMMGR